MDDLINLLVVTGLDGFADEVLESTRVSSYDYRVFFKPLTYSRAPPLRLSYSLSFNARCIVGSMAAFTSQATSAPLYEVKSRLHPGRDRM